MNNYSSFLRYIDTYKQIKHANVYDYWNLQQNIQSHYLHSYYSYYPLPTRLTPVPNQNSVIKKQTNPLNTTVIDRSGDSTTNDIYNAYMNYGIYIPAHLQIANKPFDAGGKNLDAGGKNLDTSSKILDASSKNLDALSAYSLWQNEHETQLFADISNAILRMNSSPITKKKCIIDVSINTIQDMIDLIHANPYEENVEYNIHLKELHQIRGDLEDLHNMIGMESVKQSILQQLIYFIQQLHINDFTDSSGNQIDASDFKHTVIMGPPGTGKTELAKIIGKIYSKIGILKSAVFKKVTRSELVAGYLGQTAIKTKKVIDECIGGVLFIDEAYSLGSDDSFSRECVDTLCEALSNHKKELMVIIAGYEKDLNEKFFTMNTGLSSRFIWRFSIDSYKPTELMCIFQKKIREQGWTYELSAMDSVWFTKNKDYFKHYGRDMELLWSYVKIMHAQRIYGKDPSLKKKISILDLEEGMKQFIKHMKKDTDDPFLHRDSLYV